MMALRHGYTRILVFYTAFLFGGAGALTVFFYYLRVLAKPVGEAQINLPAIPMVGYIDVYVTINAVTAEMHPFKWILNIKF